MPVVVFLVFYLAWTHEQVAGCPACVQKRLFQLFYASIPMANVGFPFLGPIIYWDIVKSRRTDRPGIPLKFHEWANLIVTPPPEPASKTGIGVRLLVIFLILLFPLSAM